MRISERIESMRDKVDDYLRLSGIGVFISNNLLEIIVSLLAITVIFLLISEFLLK